MKLIDSMFPFLVMVSGERADEAEIRSMDEHFRRLFAKNERYVLLNVPPTNQSAGAKERKLIADWANQPHIDEGIRRCCAASAIVMTSAVGRGALTAILWVWRPPVHLEIVSDVRSGVGYCAREAARAGLKLPGDPDQILASLRPLLTSAGALTG